MLLLLLRSRALSALSLSSIDENAQHLFLRVGASGEREWSTESMAHRFRFAR